MSTDVCISSQVIPGGSTYIYDVTTFTNFRGMRDIFGNKGNRKLEQMSASLVYVLAYTTLAGKRDPNQKCRSAR